MLFKSDWENHLKEFKGKPDIHALEIGAHEGLSTVWQLENILTDPTSTITSIDIFLEKEIEDRFGKYDEQYYNLYVNELNKRPVLSPFSKNILEDETIFFSKEDFNSRFSDADGDTLYSLKVANLTQFGSLQLNGKELSLNDEIVADEIEYLTYTPEKDYFGLDIFDWNASDGKDYALVPQRISIFISSGIPGVS